MTTPAERLAARKTWRRPGRNVKGPPRQRVWDCQVRAKREALRLSMHDVAAALGMSVAGYWAVEHGSDPQLTTAHRIAEFFGCGVAELWPRRLKKGKR